MGEVAALLLLFVLFLCSSNFKCIFDFSLCIKPHFLSSSATLFLFEDWRHKTKALRATARMRFSWSYFANKSSNSDEFPVHTDLVKPKFRQSASARSDGRLNANAFFIAGPPKAAASCTMEFAGPTLRRTSLDLNSYRSSRVVVAFGNCAATRKKLRTRRTRPPPSLLRVLLSRSAASCADSAALVAASCADCAALAAASCAFTSRPPPFASQTGGLGEFLRRVAILQQSPPLIPRAISPKASLSSPKRYHHRFKPYG